MRSHSGRGWKGARPPPTFNGEEEFADVPEVGDVSEEGGGESAGGGGEDEQGKKYVVPDLNNLPPDSPN